MGDYKTYIIWGIVLVLLIVMMVVGSKKQKKMMEENEKRMNELRPGDKVYTNAGIYGTILNINRYDNCKTVVLEVGESNKTELEIDLRCIVGKDERAPYQEEPEETAKEEVEESKTIEE